MTEKKKVLVLTDHMPWGHRSIAKAIYSYLKSKEKDSNYVVEYAEIKAETGMADDIYALVYKFFPKSNRLAHNVFKNKQAREIIEEISYMNLPRLKKEINKIKPDLIISAYFFHSHSLAKWRKDANKEFKLWTVAADPWTINPITFVKDADLHLVYDEVAEKQAIKFNVDENKILKTGWWVRPEMYKKYDKGEARKKLGVYDDRPIIFVGGGSLGTSSLTRILPLLMFIKKKVAFVFNTGTDRLGYNMVEQYVRLFKRIRKNNIVYIKNAGWIDNMAEVLAAADIVFGKAGPNFLFDVVATKKPFVSITHIGGQEDGNIELILDKKLGWVKEKNGEIGKFLLKYLNHPEKYNNVFNDTVKLEADNNKNSLEKVYQAVIKI